MYFFGYSSMSRKRSRKVLYEVSSEVQKAKKSGARLEISKRMRAFTNKVESRRAVKKTEKASTKAPSGLKRKLLVFVGRLFNFSIKKALVLLAVTAVVVVFWPAGGKDVPVGQESGAGNEITGKLENSAGSVVSGTESVIDSSAEFEVVVSGPPKDHCIVIASHKDFEQLKVLASYFVIKGIETEFRASGDWQTLITKDRYLSSGDPQSRFSQAKAKIIEIGNEYKPPSGFLPFKFNDIYERKIQ